jgi:hypothetical protein
MRKNLNRIAKIDKGHIWLREENLGFNNTYIDDCYVQLSTYAIKYDISFSFIYLDRTHDRCNESFFVIVFSIPWF